MADEEHEDTWLYGSTNPEPPNDSTAANSDATTAPDSTDSANKPKNDASANTNNDPKNVAMVKL